MWSSASARRNKAVRGTPASGGATSRPEEQRHPLLGRTGICRVHAGEGARFQGRRDGAVCLTGSAPGTGKVEGTCLSAPAHSPIHGCVAGSSATTTPPTRSRPPRLHTARSADHRSCGLSRQWRQGPPRAGLVMRVVGGRIESSYPTRPALCSTLRFKRRRARASGNCRLGRVPRLTDRVRPSFRK